MGDLSGDAEPGSTTINVDDKPIKLSPGMNLTAEIKTVKRRVIEFFLNLSKGQ